MAKLAKIQTAVNMRQKPVEFTEKDKEELEDIIEGEKSIKKLEESEEKVQKMQILSSISC